MAVTTKKRKTNTRTRKKKTSGRTLKLTEARREAELRAIIEMSFKFLEGSNAKQISDMTGLSLSTVKRYERGDITLDIHFRTLQALAAAGGLRIRMDEYGVKVSLIKD